MAAPPPPDAILEAFTGFHRTFALKATVELDLVSALVEGADTLPALAERCGAAERGLRALCNWLVVHGFLEKEGERYRPTEVSALYLDRRSPRYMGGSVAFIASEELRRSFEELTEAVRRGGSAASEEGTTSRENPVWVEFARAMEPMARPLARGLAQVLLADDAAPERVLDVAAGHGLYGIEVALRSPSAEVHALDWPGVLEVARANAAAAGVSERHHLLPGSAFERDWGEGYDLVLMTHFLHHFDAPGCITLLERARAALRPGGRVVVLETVPHEDRVEPAKSAAFALVMLATTPAGDAYPMSEYHAMFAAAGFDGLEALSLPDALQQALVGVRAP